MTTVFLTATQLDDSTVAKCVNICDKLYHFYLTHFNTEWITTYLHWVYTHLAIITNVLHSEFQLAYGILSTQAVEHQIKHIKKEITHTLRNNGSIKLALTHFHQTRHGWPQECMCY